jgi:hypothetical protein
MKWKVALVGPTDAVQTNTAFGLLYSFSTREEAEAHAECFLFAGTKIVQCDEPEKLENDRGAKTD